MTNFSFGLPRYYVSRVRSKCVEYNTYPGIKINFCSKPTHIHVPVH